MQTFAEIVCEVAGDMSISWMDFSLTEDESKRLGVDHTRFEVYIGYGDVEVTMDYYSCNIPMVEDVVSSLIIDAHAAQENTFYDFCDAYGYNNNSIKALLIYEACYTHASKLMLLFGEDIYHRFMMCEL